MRLIQCSVVLCFEPNLLASTKLSVATPEPSRTPGSISSPQRRANSSGKFDAGGYKRFKRGRDGFPRSSKHSRGCQGRWDHHSDQAGTSCDASPPRNAPTRPVDCPECGYCSPARSRAASPWLPILFSARTYKSAESPSGRFIPATNSIANSTRAIVMTGSRFVN